MGEFDLIERYFKRPPRQASTGIGDDCAIWTPRPGQQLAFSADMLVEGRHFLSTVDPSRLGHKCLAVNLSDLAACGATPRAFLLSLSLPIADESWLASFSSGLLALADAHDCELIGGDTTQGPLNIAITVMGEVPTGQALLRSGAQVGDDLYVSGSLGDARLALEAFRGHISLPQSVFEQARLRMEIPTPRVALGQALRGVAHAAIDISDGLLGDLRHVLKASGVGARIELARVTPLLQAQQQWTVPDPLALTCLLSGGDDYELVFTAPVDRRDAVAQASAISATPVARIGSVTQAPGLTLWNAQGEPVPDRFASFDHFG
jgi:thiamine-monophosphate kinase